MNADIDANFGPLLEHAQRANKPRGVTGGLIFTDGWFIQILEGPVGALSDVIGRIRADPRHHSMQFLVNTWAEAREFTDCSMWGYKLPPSRRAISGLLAPHDGDQVHMPTRALDLIIAARALGEHDDIMFID